jgi:hypothetical protein
VYFVGVDVPSRFRYTSRCKGVVVPGRCSCTLSLFTEYLIDVAVPRWRFEPRTVGVEYLVDVHVSHKWSCTS